MDMAIHTVLLKRMVCERVLARRVLETTSDASANCRPAPMTDCSMTAMYTPGQASVGTRHPYPEHTDSAVSANLSNP